MENWTTENWLSFSLVLVTAATLIAIILYVRSTNAMAKSTKAMAKATEDLAKAENRRQEEAIRPRLCLQLSKGEGLPSGTWHIKNIGQGYAIPNRCFSINPDGEKRHAAHYGGVRCGDTIAPQEIYKSSPVHIEVKDNNPRRLFYQDINLDWYWTEFAITQGNHFFGPFKQKPSDLEAFERQEASRVQGNFPTS